MHWQVSCALAGVIRRHNLLSDRKNRVDVTRALGLTEEYSLDELANGSEVDVQSEREHRGTNLHMDAGSRG